MPTNSRSALANEESSPMAAFNVINYRATWDDTEETSLEAVWYGLWNRVLWDFVMHTPLPKQEFLNVHPQDALTKSPWPAEQLEGDSDQPRRNTRQNPAQEGQFESLSAASSSVLAIDSISAAFSDTLSISGAGDSESQRHVDMRQYPDFTVKLKRFLEIPPEAEHVFLDTVFPPRYAPLTRIIMIVEIKPLPTRLSSTNSQSKKTHLAAVEKVLDNDMRSQVYNQVRFAFENDPQQETIIHLSAVGYYCKVRWFNRKRLQEGRHLPITPSNRDHLPQWSAITNSTDVKMFPLIEVGKADFHFSFKTAWTRALHDQQRKMSRHA